MSQTTIIGVRALLKYFLFDFELVDGRSVRPFMSYIPGCPQIR